MQQAEQERMDAAVNSTVGVDADEPMLFGLQKAMQHLRLAAEVRRDVITPQQEIQQLIDERSSMQQAMYAVLARIGSGVESLSGEDESLLGEESRWRHELMEAACKKNVKPVGLMGSEMDISVATKDGVRGNPAASAEVAALSASAMTPRNTVVVGEGTKVIASKREACQASAGWQRPRVIADKPQEFSDDSDEHIEDELRGSNDDDSSSSNVEVADVLALASSGSGEPGSSSVVQRLLASMKVDARLQVLEDLELDFAQRQAGLQKESRELEDMEVNLQTDDQQAEQTSADLLQALDKREASLYRVLRHYGHSLSGLVAGKLPLKEPPTQHSDTQNSERLLVPDRDFLQEQNMAGFSYGSAPNAQVILNAVSAIQENFDFLRQVVDMEASQLQACEHAERELNKAAQSASDTPLSDPVVAHIVNEFRQAAQLKSLDCGEVQDDIIESQARLTMERDWLHAEVLKEAARAAAVAAGVSVKHLPSHSLFFRLKRRRKLTVVKSMPLVRASGKVVGSRKLQSRPEVSSQDTRYALFGTDMQQQHAREIASLRDHCAQMERQIRDMQILKQTATNAVPVIQHSAHRFEEILQLARRKVEVGELPAEENRSDRLLRELRKLNEDVDRKQKFEHAKEMQKLETLEHRYIKETVALNEQAATLTAELKREKRIDTKIVKELDWVASRKNDAVKRLENLDWLNTQEVQEETANSLHATEKMKGLLGGENDALKEALRDTSNSAKLFEHVRAAAATMISNKETVLQQNRLEEAHNIWHALLDSFQQEDRSEEQKGKDDEEMEDAVLALCAKATNLLGGDGSQQGTRKRPLKLDNRKVRRSATADASSNSHGGLNEWRTEPRTDSPQFGDVAARRPKLLRGRTYAASTFNAPHGLLSPARLRAERQHHSLDQHLRAAEDDGTEANQLKEKTAELNILAKTMERRLVLALGLHDKKELPSELRQRHRDAVVPKRVQDLRQEVQAQHAELESLSRRLRPIRNMAKRVSKRDGTGADVDGEDLREELVRLCGKALRHRGQIYVRKKVQHEARAKLDGPRSPHSTSSEELASTVSHEAPSRQVSKTKQTLPRPETLQE